MILNVVFSYNRAMQLDCFLDSFIRHVKYPEYEIAIVYHTTEDHKKGYRLLLKKYEKYNNIKFYERTNQRYYYLKILPLLSYPRNLYRFIKYKYLRVNVDNFKFLVEDVIKYSDSEFIMFSTDDTYYDSDVFIPEDILYEIRQNSMQSSYRLCLGKNLNYEEVPGIREANKALYWNYSDVSDVKGWIYPFIVDGTVYQKKVIYNIIRKILYHMPATLESFVNTYVEHNKLFNNGICPNNSCVSNI
jgi:hypothetical protein